jgi:hypothetical protein
MDTNLGSVRARLNNRESAALAVGYVPGEPWSAEHLDATVVVVVVGYENAPAIGARFIELPELRLVQTLNAGYEQWLPLLPPG